jgi:putative addiction module component (TIGR02574 family)
VKNRAKRVEVPEPVPMSDAVREELDRRLDAYYADPSTARRWREIQKELFGIETTASR